MAKVELSNTRYFVETSRSRVAVARAMNKVVAASANYVCHFLPPLVCWLAYVDAVIFVIG
jgi:hypothetical protein